MADATEVEVTESAALVIEESQGIISAQNLLTTPVEAMTPEAVVAAWSVIDLVEKKLFTKRKKVLGDRLKAMALEDGAENDRGSKALEIGFDGVVTAQATKGKVTYDLAALRGVLEERDIEPNSCIRTVYEVDEKGIEMLLTGGLLTPDDLKRFTTVADKTFSLKVKKPARVTALLPG